MMAAARYEYIIYVYKIIGAAYDNYYSKRERQLWPRLSPNDGL